MKKKEKNDISIEKSLFNLCLTNTLSDYGLKDSPYKLKSVTKEEDESTTSTWVPIKENEKLYGTIILSNIGTKVSGIVVYKSKQELVKKSFYKDYLNVNTIDFPGSVTEITYPDNTGTEDYQITTYSNILIDTSGEDEMYGYRIPSK